MANNKILTETVRLFNYVGEVDDKAFYQETVLHNCYLSFTQGASTDNQGKTSSDVGRLYLFDKKTIALSPDNNKRTYIPFDQWILLGDKSNCWTLSDKGTDYVLKGDFKMKIIGFSYKKAGTRRMWHYEVDTR